MKTDKDITRKFQTNIFPEHRNRIPNKVLDNLIFQNRTNKQVQQVCRIQGNANANTRYKSKCKETRIVKTLLKKIIKLSNLLIPQDFKTCYKTTIINTELYCQERQVDQ